jgi:hypothetical protein
MARAFTFLKSTSVSCGGLGDGAGVTLEDNGGVVAAADALGDAPPVGVTLGGVSSCAVRKETAHIESNGMQNEARAIMRYSLANIRVFAMYEILVS